MTRRRILFLLLAATLLLAGYLRLRGEPGTRRVGALVPPRTGTDRWLRKRADTRRMSTLRLILPCDITLKGWRAIGDMESLDWLEIESAQPGRHQLLPSAEGLRELARLPRDRAPSLSIWFVEMTAPGMQALAEIPRLRRLDIAYLAGVTSEEIARLGQIRTRSLQIRGIALDEVSLRGLAGDSSRVSVRYEECQLTDSHIAQFETYRGIGSLSLRRNRIQGAGLGHLAHLGDLRELDLTSNPIDDAGVAHLPTFRKLEHLSLRGTRVSDSGLARLPDLPALSSLDLRSTLVTDAGLAHLLKFTRLGELHLPAGVMGTGLSQLRAIRTLDRLTLPGVADRAGLRAAFPEWEITVVD